MESVFVIKLPRSVIKFPSDARYALTEIAFRHLQKSQTSFGPFDV